MRIGYSIAIPLIGLITLVACGTAAVHYQQTARAQKERLTKDSERNVRHVAVIVESMIRGDVQRLGALTRSLSGRQSRSRCAPCRTTCGRASLRSLRAS